MWKKIDLYYDLILSTIIFSPFCSWERLTYLPKLAVEFLLSVWNCHLVMMKFTIACFYWSLIKYWYSRTSYGLCPQGVFSLVRWEYHRNENQQFKTYSWVSFITALDVLTLAPPPQETCLRDRIYHVYPLESLMLCPRGFVNICWIVRWSLNTEIWRSIKWVWRIRVQTVKTVLWVKAVVLNLEQFCPPSLPRGLFRCHNSWLGGGALLLTSGG